MDNEKEISKEELHKEIDLIQSCINRMANNSFLLKGWTVSLIAVILALSPDDIDGFVVTVAVFVTTVSFWYLDAFFLRTERMYRKMYNWVLKNREQGNRKYQYDLNPQRFVNEVPSIWNTMRSNTLSLFYGMFLLGTLIILMYNLFPYYKGYILTVWNFLSNMI